MCVASQLFSSTGRGFSGFLSEYFRAQLWKLRVKPALPFSENDHAVFGVSMLSPEAR